MYMNGCTVRYGAEKITFDVEIDETMLEALAIKAAGNKSGKSKVGPVKVKITGRREVG